MNLLQEERNGHIISHQMKEVWAKQIEMVQKLLSVCSKYGLKIWADGGTLLGTIRENGYIPWDDDIDMLMMREDYDKLLSVAPKEFQHPYFFQCAYTDRRYFRGHSQLRYDGTTAILPYDVWQPFHQGIFIDIFVYDAIPDTEDHEWRERINRADYIEHQLQTSQYFISSIIHPSSITELWKSRIYCMLHGYRSLFREYEDLFRFYKLSDCYRIACPCFNRRIFKTATKKKEWYSDTIWHPFEDIQLPIPIGYDSILRTQYGDNYMTPAKAPSIHGGFLSLDANVSYIKTIKEIRCSLRKEKWRRRIDRLIRLVSGRHKYEGSKTSPR